MTNPTFPCNAETKAPLVATGFHAATDNEIQIEAWRQEFPGCLWGVPTGERTGWTVVDVDLGSRKPEKAASAKAWLAANKLPRTRVVKTRSGGLHIFFQHVPGIPTRTDTPAPGVDVRNDGGYVIDWAGHGFPVLIDEPLAVMPDWLRLALARDQADHDGSEPKDTTPPPSIDAVVELLDALPNPASTTRDEWVKLCGAAAWCAEQLDDADERIKDAWVRWSDRWEGGAEEGSAGKWDYETARPHRAGWATLAYYGRAHGIGVSRREPEDEFDGVLKDHTEAPKAEQKKSNPRYRFVTEAGIDDMPDPEWLIDKVLPSQGFAPIFGPPKQGKTFVALAMALHVAAGKPWFGHDVPHGAVVLYVAGEGAGGLKLRLRAARGHYGLPMTDNFIAQPSSTDMCDPEQVKALIRDLRAVAGERRVAVVFVDTLARNMVGDENATKDMGAFVKGCDAIRDAFECVVVPVHHSGKDTSKGARGSTALTGAADALFEVTRQKDETQDVVTFATVYQKEAEEAEPLFFDLVYVPGEFQARGSMALAQRAEAPAGGGTSEKVGKAQKALLGLVMDMLIEQGGGGKLYRQDIINRAMEGTRVSVAERQSNKRANIKDALDGLVDRGSLAQDGELVWVAGLEA